ncbi:MAG: GGDEF domain-containing protein [Treponema sp.]|nr:GGDEF domain-containing protein [Treponema sp.]
MDKIISFISDFTIGRSFKSFLSDLFEVLIITMPDEAAEAIAAGDISLILIDLSQNTSIPEDFLAYLCQEKIIEKIPVAVILEKTDIEKEITLLSNGCSEIFYQPFDSIIIRKRLLNLVKIKSLSSNVSNYEKQLITDPLTGLLNKAGFISFVRKIIRLKKPGAFIMCDMDGLKFINDNYSHQVGDDIIVNVADCLYACMPDDAFVAHISGDEFCVFLNDITSRERISELCATFQKTLLRKALLPDLARPVTASIGIALFPETGTTFDILQNKADHAMVYVKNHGKNGFKFHEARDDREEQLKGRQECTNISMDLMLKPRDGEEIQTWLKFGEFRIVFLTYQKYAKEKFEADYCLLNIVDKENPENPDSAKVVTINTKISTFIKDALFPGIFSWYSINQLLVFSTEMENFPQGIERLKRELKEELEYLQLEIQLIRAS